MPLLSSTFGFLLAMILSIMTTPLIIKLALKWQVVDKPDHRKVHLKIMPRMGGLAIYTAFAFSYFIFIPITKESFGIFLGGTVIVFTGMLDDKFQLSPKVKMLGQILATIVIVMSGLKIQFVSLPFNNYINFQYLSMPITILWIVGVTNAINLIDGLDGLAAGVSGISVSTIMIMAYITYNKLAFGLSTILLGAIIGFLFFNFHPAKIFMGDTGSLFLGFNLAVLSILGFKQVTIIAFIIPILILGVPISDTLYAIARRILNRKPITAPDKNHLHHCLLSMGLTHTKTVLIIYSISTCFAIVAVLLSQSSVMSAGFILAITIIMLQAGSEKIGLMGETNKPLTKLIKFIKVHCRSKVQ